MVVLRRQCNEATIRRAGDFGRGNGGMKRTEVLMAASAATAEKTPDGYPVSVVLAGDPDNRRRCPSSDDGDAAKRRHAPLDFRLFVRRSVRPFMVYACRLMTRLRWIFQALAEPS